jgi:hypothetical protein
MTGSSRRAGSGRAGCPEPDRRAAAVSQTASPAGKDAEEWLSHPIAVPDATPGPPLLIRQAAASDRPALA